MDKCSGITRSGEACKGKPFDNSQWCYYHHPEYVEEREVPEVYRQLEKAADIPAALAQLRPDRPDLAPHTIEGVFDIDHLLETCELVVRAEALEPAVDMSE